MVKEGSTPEDGVTYPREVPADPGLPPGWKVVEKLYGATSKFAGGVYRRFQSVDDKHKGIATPKQVFEIHCQTHGGDPVAMHAEFLKAQKERQAQRKQERDQEREAKGILNVEKREAHIERFRERFGPLTGPVVLAFPGWTIRWRYLDKCEQVQSEYIDPQGKSFKLLKDLEVHLQKSLESGDSNELAEMIESAQSRADPAQFSDGIRLCKESKQVFEMSSEGSRVISKAELKESAAKRPRVGNNVLGLDPEAVPQTGWAAISGTDSAAEAFSKFMPFLKEKGFSTDTTLAAVVGVPQERRLVSRVSGVYHELPEPVSGQRCFQKLLHFPDKGKVGCDGIYIVWSVNRFRWEIATELTETRPVIAYLPDSQDPITELNGTWQLQDGQGEFSPEKGLSLFFASAAPLES